MSPPYASIASLNPNMISKLIGNQDYAARTWMSEGSEIVFRKTACALLCVAAIAVGLPASASIGPQNSVDQPRIEIPANITLTFGVPIIPEQSTADVTGPNGRIPIGPLRHGVSKDELLIPLSDNLLPGSYRVTFKAAAGVGKRIKGSVSITVKSSASEPVAADQRGAR